MKKINVTKTFLPPIEEYEQYVQTIWDNNWLTNQGPLLTELETKIRSYLNVQNFHYVANGTLALQLALKSLDINEGEIITTPFSYVATTSAILWQGCKPVYVDIDPVTLCIDADNIEAAITPKSRAIMPVHIYGLSCDIDRIESIAKKHNLKVIYDAAHAFGSKYKGKSLLNFGDVSTCSFHATKPFHTVEGGACIVKSQDVNARLELAKRFGHNGDDHLQLGINAKNSEFHAAMGLAILPYIDKIIYGRKKIFEIYRRMLPKFQYPIAHNDLEYNFAYYPIIFKSNEQLLKVLKALNELNIFPRRYFYPSLNKLPYVSGQECPVSEDISSRVACLPLYVGLEDEVIEKIVRTVNEI